MRLRDLQTPFIIVFLLLGTHGISSQLTAQCSPTALEIPNNGTDEDCDGLDDIFLHLPPHIYLVEGKNFELYFRNIILSTHPQDYVFEVQTTLPGTNASGKWSFTPNFSHSGEHSMTIRIKTPGGQTLATASSIVRISPANSPAGLPTQRVILLGHSFIDQGYMPHYFRLLTEEAGNPSIQLKGKQFNWVDGISVHEAKGGASWKSFLKNSDSPLWYFGKFDFPRYFNDVLCQGCRPEVMVIHLDVNDYCFAGNLEGATIQQIEDYIQADYVSNIQPFMTALRAAAPNTKIAISYTPPPNSRQGSFTGHFGSGSILANRYRWKKIVNTIYFKYSEYFAGREGENIYLLPIHLDVDDVNEFDNIDPVHPWKTGQSLSEPSGYKEIAKSTYAWVKYVLNIGANGACVINTSATPPVCNNNGTALNPADDTYTFSLTANAINAGSGWTATINSTTQTAAYGTARNLGPFNISAGPISFTVRDQVTSTCQSPLTITPPATCSNGSGTTIDLELSMTTNPVSPVIYSDFTNTIRVRNTNPLAATNVQVSIPKPGNSVNYIAGNPFTASQGDFRWYSDFIWNVGNIPPLGSATITLNYFLLTANPLNLYAQVTTASPTDPDSTPGNGNGTTANEDDEVVLTINSPTQAPCSISAMVANPICSNNGTTTNPADDTFTTQLTVTGTNTGTSGWTATISGQTVTGQFGVARNVGPFPISGGPINVTLTDAQKTTCTTTAVLTPPSPCSTPGGGGTQTDLSLSISGSAPTAAAYSFVSTIITVQNTSSVAATGIVVAVVNPTDATYKGGDIYTTAKGTFNWWQNQWLVGDLAAGQSATLTVNYFTLSANAMRFYAQITAATPIDSDSAPNNGNSTSANEDDEAVFNLNGSGGGTPTCSISAVVSNIACNNNGTTGTSTDDTYTFSLLVTGTATGSAWSTTVNGQTLIGNYNTARIMGPFPITGGTFNLTIRDTALATCTTQITVTQPATCSATNSANCASTSAHPWHEWISRVQFGTLTRNSDKSPYSDFTATKVPITAGQSRTFTLTGSYSFFTYDEYWRVWIDYNQNGIFEDATELAFSGVMTKPAAATNVTKTIAGIINVPPSALNGDARMRISMKREAYATACETLPNGEVEDYTVTISGGVQPLLAPKSLAGILHFSAKEQLDGVQLDWIAPEGVVEQTIERASRGGEFVAMEYLENLDPSLPARFVWLDKNPSLGENTYRIAAKTSAQGVLQSDHQVVFIEKQASIRAFPNPAQSDLRIYSKDFDAQTLRYSVINALGGVVETKALTLGAGQESFPLSVAHYPSGVFTVLVEIEGKRPVLTRFVVQE